LVAIILVSLPAAACNDQPHPPTLFSLPEVTSPPNFGGCTGVGFDAKEFLAGDPNFRPVAFARTSAGKRIEILWPPGYNARFDPRLEIVGPTGEVVAREGDEITASPLPWAGLVACPSLTQVSVYRASEVH
jgi:hypothetical protein